MQHEHNLCACLARRCLSSTLKMKKKTDRLHNCLRFKTNLNTAQSICPQMFCHHAVCFVTSFYHYPIITCSCMPYSIANDWLCLAIFASFHQMAFDARVAISAGKPETCFVMACPLPAGSHTLPFD